MVILKTDRPKEKKWAFTFFRQKFGQNSENLSQLLHAHEKMSFHNFGKLFRKNYIQIHFGIFELEISDLKKKPF